ncbi:MAG: nitrous oxide reductase family maturation protein NosD [Ferruginibacter sp.]
MRSLSFILTLFLFSLTCVAKTITVGTSGAFQKIQDAINASQNGDVIIVEAGNYNEKDLIVNKSVTLQGKGYPVLDGDHLYEIISVKANNVTIQGFKLVHSGVSSIVDIAGIKIYACRNVVIADNIFMDTFFGIYLQNASNCIIKDNKLFAYATTEQQSGNGIHCWQSDSLQVVGNTITGHRDGIYFEFVTNSVIWRNYSVDNMRYGLHFMFSHNNAYISNIFQRNGAGASVMFSHGVKMFNNTFEDNWGDGAYGVFLKEMSDSYIIGNKFTKNTVGVFMEGATNIHVEKNIFLSNGWAFKIQASSSNVTITHNNFIANTYDIGTNGSLVLNSFNENYWDKYDGYDLNKDKLGDVPYRPVSMFAMIVEKNPSAMILFRSFMASLLDKTEKLLPSLTPENLKDDHPLMKPLKL